MHLRLLMAVLRLAINIFIARKSRSLFWLRSVVNVTLVVEFISATAKVITLMHRSLLQNKISIVLIHSRCPVINVLLSWQLHLIGGVVTCSLTHGIYHWSSNIAMSVCMIGTMMNVMMMAISFMMYVAMSSGSWIYALNLACSVCYNRWGYFIAAEKRLLISHSLI